MREPIALTPNQVFKVFSWISAISALIVILAALTR